MCVCVQLRCILKIKTKKRGVQNEQLESWDKHSVIQLKETISLNTLNNIANVKKKYCQCDKL